MVGEMVGGATATLPDSGTLTDRIRLALGDDAALLLDRRPNEYMTSFCTEVVTCRLADGRAVRLFCKHGSAARDGSFGHRLGVAYEVEVYRQVLVRSGLSTPRFYGGWTGPAGQALLLIEYLEDACRLEETLQPSEALLAAVTWVAGFQRRAELRRAEMPSALTRRRLGHDYYVGWSRRAADTLARMAPPDDRVEAVREGFERSLHLLTEADLVPVHGELYPHNVLVHRGEVRPIDWESTALAAGEIDLASLVERWSVDDVETCCAVYARTRWPDGPPPDFPMTLDMARAYLHFRWIAVGPSPRKPLQWRIDELCEIGARLGFLPR
jgi:hypothetical protein